MPFSQTSQPIFTSTVVTAGTATVSNVASSATNTQLLASNSFRKGAFFHYLGTANLYLKCGTTASTSSFTIKIPGGGYYELPSDPIYTGEIDGIWDVANGSVNITELS